MLCKTFCSSPQRRCCCLSRPAVSLLNNEVSAATMRQPAYDSDAFARAWMLSVLDQNVKGLFLGSMSPSRKEQ
jgi:hypothetical protein